MNDWFPVRALFSAAFLVTAAAPPARAAAPEIPVPVVRLLVPGGAGESGIRDVGIEFVLPEGWHTYWRNPGDAGLPATFDTTGSINLAGFEVAWPAPERRDDDGVVSLVFYGNPLLPVRVVPVDPARSVELHVRVDYGYCREICVPASIDLSASIAADGPVDRSAAARLAEARAALPRPEAAAPADAPRIAAVERIGDDPKTALLRITVSGGDPGELDLFAEPPEGWYLTVPRRVATQTADAVFELPLKGMPRKAVFAGAPFRFTLVTPRGAFEASRRLD